MTTDFNPHGHPVIEETNVMDRDPLRRPVIMDKLELITVRYAYEITQEQMRYIEKRDAEQWNLRRKPLSELLSEVSDAHFAGYYFDGKHIYFELSIRHNTYESLQEVIDHVTMYIEGLDCHWITGEMGDVL